MYNFYLIFLNESFVIKSSYALSPYFTKNPFLLNIFFIIICGRIKTPIGNKITKKIYRKTKITINGKRKRKNKKKNGLLSAFSLILNKEQIKKLIIFFIFFLLFVDLGRIELPFRQCECRVLPLNHRPVFQFPVYIP